MPRSSATLQHRIASIATPAELGLGDDVTPQIAEKLVTHLYDRWCTLSVAQGAPATEQQLGVCVGGLFGAYFRLSGRTFVGDTTRDRLSYRSIEDVALAAGDAVKLAGLGGAPLESPVLRQRAAVQLAVGPAVVRGVLVMQVFVYHIHTTFESIDVDQMNELKH